MGRWARGMGTSRVGESMVISSLFATVAGNRNNPISRDGGRLDPPRIPSCPWSARRSRVPCRRRVIGPCCRAIMRSSLRQSLCPPVEEVGDLNCDSFYAQGIYGIVLTDPTYDPHGLDGWNSVDDGYGCEGA
jgi:hypothetical protein